MVLARIREKLGSAKRRIAIVAAAASTIIMPNVAHAQSTSIDTSSMTQMISAFLPIIMSLFAIMIPLMFFGKIMEFFERLLKSFSG